MTRILICDDEPDLREMVSEYLAGRGYDTRTARDGATLDSALMTGPLPDIILLDITMPGEDGLSILRRLRRDHDLAVIMLTAVGETVDRIVGLEMGADDYLAKPVDLRELDARIKAVLRRAGRGGSGATAQGAAARVDFDGLVLDLGSARLIGRDGAEIPLTAMEFRLLRVFLDNRGRVLNRDQLLEQAHDRAWDPFDRSVDIQVSRLRRKIERVPGKPALLRTVRGIGYVFDDG